MYPGLPPGNGGAGGVHSVPCTGALMAPSGRPLRRWLQPRPCRKCCTHCGRRTARLTRGRCSACYMYQRRQGVERPLTPTPPRPCQTCGLPGPVLRRGWCRTCYQYWYRTGRERPARLWPRWIETARGAASWSLRRPRDDLNERAINSPLEAHLLALYMGQAADGQTPRGPDDTPN